MDKRQKVIWIQVIVTLLGMIILFGQLMILIRQTEIIENSNPPYEPYIKIIPDLDDSNLKIWALDITDKRNVEGDLLNNQRWATIDLTIYNFGQMDSQRITFDPEEKNKSIFSYITYNTITNNIDNIPAGTSKRIKLHIRDTVCQKNEIKLCEHPELIPTGKQEIVLNIECLGCGKQRYFSEKINFCIYYKNKAEECPDQN